MRKKTEHTNIARSSLKLLRQNIHVMLSYAKIRTTKNQNLLTSVINLALEVILGFGNDRHLRDTKKKKRSTQTSLALL